MERSHTTRTRLFSFAIPALMDGMLGLSQTALPLLAMRFGASPWFLGMLGWTGQSVRFPATLASGALSDVVGRLRIIIPAGLLAGVACVGFALSSNKWQVLGWNILLVASIGAFYPCLQAFIGDRSPQGQLRKNLSAFNVGWTVGGSVCALAAGYLLAKNQWLPFGVGAAFTVVLTCLVLIWARTPMSKFHESAHESATIAADGPGVLLPIARIGHFLGFFGFSMGRYLFPKLAKVELDMSDATIGSLVSMLHWGQATGILLASVGPWWRWKLWPQVFAQLTPVVSGLVVFFAVSPWILSGAFLLQGIGLGVAYTGALYYGLQARTKMGRNTGIHESLVAAAHFLGSLVGGTAAQFISLRAPYMMFAILSSCALVVTAILWLRAPHRAHVRVTA